jgi:hypothetical protein
MAKAKKAETKTEAKAEEIKAAPEAKTETKTNSATRKVKFQTLYTGTYGVFMPNQIAIVPALFAESAISSKAAVYVD